jgi:hypothetical protein
MASGVVVMLLAVELCKSQAAIRNQLAATLMARPTLINNLAMAFLRALTSTTQHLLQEDLAIQHFHAISSQATQQYPREVVWAYIHALSLLKLRQSD